LFETVEEEAAMKSTYDTIVIGGGQAGLAAAYHLSKAGRDFVVLDENDRVGDSWRTRWDSLRLFTPAKFSSLPGLKHDAPKWSFPTKDEMGEYLAGYAEQFDLAVRTGVHVDRLTRADGRFVVIAGDDRFEADNVIVATGAHRVPKMPAFASELDPRIVQMHSSEYRSPAQLQDGDVLLVGFGNSGAEIAHELAATHRCFLAGKNPGQIPAPHGSRRSRVAFTIVRMVGHNVLRRDTPIGRKVGPKFETKTAPLIRRKEKDLLALGVERVPRVVGVQEGLPLLDDGRVLEVANVIWCTGFRTDFEWIDLPAFDADGRPRHDRGVAASEEGLYFVGLVFQYAVSSDVLPGVGRDAEHVVRHLVARSPRAAEARRVLTPAAGAGTSSTS
jgi:putative flavoprotein involved in K+ transport